MLHTAPEISFYPSPYLSSRIVKDRSLRIPTLIVNITTHLPCNHAGQSPWSSIKMVSYSKLRECIPALWLRPGKSALPFHARRPLTDSSGCSWWSGYTTDIPQCDRQPVRALPWHHRCSIRYWLSRWLRNRSCMGQQIWTAAIGLVGLHCHARRGHCPS